MAAVIQPDQFLGPIAFEYLELTKCVASYIRIYIEHILLPTIT